MRARRIGLLLAITAVGIASACASDETPDDSTEAAVATDTPAVEPAPTEAPATAPPRTDPPETEPPDTEPVEPVNTQAPSTEPITTDPPATEPVQNSPGDLEAWCLQWASDVPAGDIQTTFEGIVVRAEAMLAVAPQEIAEASAVLVEKNTVLKDFLAENDWDPTASHPDPELAENLNQSAEQVETYAAANC